MCQEFNKYWIKNQKSAYEMVKEIINEQGIKIKENNMEDRNKTVAELIADLQNQLNRANNHIDELVKKNDELKEINNTQFKNLHDLRREYNGLYNKFHALVKKYSALIGKYCDYNKAAQDAWNENNKLKKEIERLKNKNEYFAYENDNLSKEITKWHNKYTKEKAKHDKATKMIDELKKHQKGKLACLRTAINSVYGSTSLIGKYCDYNKAAQSDKRRRDNIDSLLYSYWGLKEYYQEAKCNKNEANDQRRDKEKNKE